MQTFLWGCGVGGMVQMSAKLRWGYPLKNSSVLTHLLAVLRSFGLFFLILLLFPLHFSWFFFSDLLFSVVHCTPAWIQIMLTFFPLYPIDHNLWYLKQFLHFATPSWNLYLHHLHNFVSQVSTKEFGSLYLTSLPLDFDASYLVPVICHHCMMDMW